MENDISPGGRGFHLVEKLDREVSEGKFTSLEAWLRARRQKPRH